MPCGHVMQDEPVENLIFFALPNNVANACACS